MIQNADFYGEPVNHVVQQLCDDWPVVPSRIGCSLPYHNINADHTSGDEYRVVDIENVRGLKDQYKLDNAGFQFGREALNPY